MDGRGGIANQQCQIRLQIVKHIVLESHCFVDNFLVFIIFRFVSRKTGWRGKGAE